MAQETLGPSLGGLNLGMTHDVLGCQNCWTGQEIRYCPESIYNRSHPFHVCPGFLVCCSAFILPALFLVVCSLNLH
jgi:hypothetical protein